MTALSLLCLCFLLSIVSYIIFPFYPGNKTAVIWNGYLTICCLHRKKNEVHVRHHSGVTEVIAAFQMTSSQSPVIFSTSGLKPANTLHAEMPTYFFVIFLSASPGCLFLSCQKYCHSYPWSTSAFKMKILKSENKFLKINFVGEGRVFMQVYA